MGIAHRTWPIGGKVLITNLRTGKQARGLVIDRGPYGKLDSRGRWFNSRRERKRQGKFRGCADLTPALAKAIQHNGLEMVQITLIREDKP